MNAVNPMSGNKDLRRRHRIRMLKEGPIEADLPTREDLPFLSTRLMLLFFGFCLVLAAFGARVYKLTIIDGRELRNNSDNNFQKEEPLLAPRGKILDRNNQPLAINQPLFDVEMSPFHLKPNEIRATLNRVATLLNRPQIIKKADEIVKLYPKWNSVSLLDHRPIALGEILPLREQAFDLPGVVIVPQYQRCYPEGSVAGLITGYVGGINEKQMDHFLDEGYSPTEKIGGLGAERTFELLLHGEHGRQLVERDSKGRPRSQPFTSQPAQPGNILTLTIDLGLQRLADALLEGWNGVIIAMDPRDGSVLAMAARPHYDPIDPLGRHMAKDLFSSFNKVTRSKFAPGSTYKLVTASAGLLVGFSPKERINCDGWYSSSGVRYPCSFRQGHGDLDLFGALQKSCNIYFYTWANRVGAARMIDMSRAYGFGDRTDFELTVPEEESPGKVAQIGVDKIYQGSVIQMGIGQGAMIDLTPIQLARAYAAVANGGTLYRPRILKEVRTATGELVKEVKTTDGRVIEVGKAVAQGKLPISEVQRQEIIEGFRRTINEPGGTAYGKGGKLYNPEWHAAGKSGTAQTGQKGVKPNAWFAAFAPLENPEILFLILIEKSGHGGDIAAPLVRQLMAYHFGQPEPVIQPPPKGDIKPIGDEE